MANTAAITFPVFFTSTATSSGLAVFLHFPSVDATAYTGGMAEVSLSNFEVSGEISAVFICEAAVDFSCFETDAKTASVCSVIFPVFDIDDVSWSGTSSINVALSFPSFDVHAIASVVNTFNANCVFPTFYVDSLLTKEQEWRAACILKCFYIPSGGCSVSSPIFIQCDVIFPCISIGTLVSVVPFTQIPDVFITFPAIRETQSSLSVATFDVNTCDISFPVFTVSSDVSGTMVSTLGWVVNTDTPMFDVSIIWGDYDQDYDLTIGVIIFPVFMTSIDISLTDLSIEMITLSDEGLYYTMEVDGERVKYAGVRYVRGERR